MSKLALLAACLAGSLSTVATSAAAQDSNASILKDVTFSSDPVQGRQNLREFADCLVSTRSKKAVGFLRVPLNEAGSQVQQFVEDSTPCSPGVAIRLYLFHIRGALFESLYLKNFRAPPATIHPGAYSTAGDPRALVACMVGRDPASVDAYIRTYPGTDGEQKKLQQLVPALNACLSQMNAKNAPNTSMLRAATAEVLYCAEIDGAECKL